MQDLVQWLVQYQSGAGAGTVSGVSAIWCCCKFSTNWREAWKAGISAGGLGEVQRNGPGLLHILPYPTLPYPTPHQTIPCHLTKGPATYKSGQARIS